MKDQLDRTKKWNKKYKWGLDFDDQLRVILGDFRKQCFTRQAHTYGVEQTIHDIKEVVSQNLIQVFSEGDKTIQEALEKLK